MIMVDELRTWMPPTTVPRVFRAGSCHLTTDGSVEELHAFARQLGLRRGWFQDGTTPHYDLTAPRRARALEQGAVFVPARDQARARRAARRQRNGSS